jgi:hypothetical protein
MYDDLYGHNCSDWSECSSSCNADPPLASAYQSRSCRCRDVYRDLDVPRLSLPRPSYAMRIVHRRLLDSALRSGRHEPVPRQPPCGVDAPVHRSASVPTDCHRSVLSPHIHLWRAAMRFALLLADDALKPLSLQKSRRQLPCPALFCSYGCAAQSNTCIRYAVRSAWYASVRRLWHDRARTSARHRLT